ncbi:MAG: FtsX-like permease family protein [Nanoarchaeota archaeon]
MAKKDGLMAKRQAINSPAIYTSAFLAAKDIAADKKTVALVIILLAFSFVNLTFSAAFIRGLGNTFQDEIVNTDTGHVVMQVRTDLNRTYLDRESLIRQKINTLPGVIGSATHTEVPAVIVANGKQVTSSLIAIKPTEESQVSWIESEIIDGKFLSDNDLDEIIIGKRLAGIKEGKEPGILKKFGRDEDGLGGVTAGDVVTVFFANGEKRQMHVKGIAGRDGPGVVLRQAFITQREAQDAANISQKATKILIKLSSRELAGAVKNMVLDLGIPGADVKTYREASSFIEALNQTFGIVVYITSIVGIIIAMIIISIVTTINVGRKRRAIAVLKAIGAQSSTILLTFTIESIIFGAAGVSLGIVLSKIIVIYLSNNPISLPIGLLRPDMTLEMMKNAAIALMAAVFISGLIPAYKGAQQEILKYIRGE